MKVMLTEVLAGDHFFRQSPQVGILCGGEEGEELFRGFHTMPGLHREVQLLQSKSVEMTIQSIPCMISRFIAKSGRMQAPERGIDQTTPRTSAR